MQNPTNISNKDIIRTFAGVIAIGIWVWGYQYLLDHPDTGNGILLPLATVLTIVAIFASGMWFFLKPSKPSQETNPQEKPIPEQSSGEKTYRVRGTVCYNETYSGRVETTLQASNKEKARELFQRLARRGDLATEISQANMSPSETHPPYVYEMDPIEVEEIKDHGQSP